MWNLKKMKQNSEYNNQDRLTDKEKKLVVFSGEKEVGRDKIGARD